MSDLKADPYRQTEELIAIAAQAVGYKTGPVYAQLATAQATLAVAAELRRFNDAKFKNGVIGV